jgi:hypothetical protein
MGSPSYYDDDAPSLDDFNDHELLAEVTKRGYEVVEDILPPKWDSVAACQREYDAHMMYLKRCKYDASLKENEAWYANLK